MTREEAIKQSVLRALNDMHPGTPAWIRVIFQTILRRHEQEGPSTWSYLVRPIEEHFKELSNEIQG